VEIRKKLSASSGKTARPPGIWTPGARVNVITIQEKSEYIRSADDT
jgi:hypothetical protein